MSDAAEPLCDPSDPASADPGLLGRQLAMLGRLAEAGLEIAIALEHRAKSAASAPADDPVDLDVVALAYSRVARAVRQTIMLQSKLIADRQDRDKAAANRRAAAKASAARLIRGAIEDERGNDTERVERLSREAAERLSQEDFTGLLSRPFAEAVVQIVRDLGLNPDWLRLTEDCLTAEAVLTGKPVPAPPEDEDIEYEVQWLNETDSS